jgi:thiamine-phosphate pyrophosphorylase
MGSEIRARLRGLYAITPESEDTASLVARVEQCLAGGAALVQYRAKRAGPALAREQARRIASLCRSFDVPFIVNDSIELAAACGAQGVHLGRDDASVQEARRALPGAIVGVSCYSDPRIARAAAEAGADYVAIGSVFPSGTKPDAARAPLGCITEASRAGLPVAAIGGITLDNAQRALDAGADMLAVISSLFDAADIRAAARAFSDRFEDADPQKRGQPQSRAL